MTHYPDVDQNPDFPAIETKLLEGWKQSNAFARSIENRTPPLSPPQAGGMKGGEFVFYDGPPFANGLPHYGHLLTGFVKDAIARYQTMRGKKVERRFGWDCHGLPAEMGSEKELGISGRAAITNFGIGKFNEHCRTSVMKYTQEWEYYVNRQARWVDFANDYKTMDKNFMESVLWAFKQLYDKGLVYEAYRVMPYSWAAETPLSNFETKLDNSYREREDKAITVAFELNEAPKGAPKADKYFVLAWTTTPWTLPSNLALAVGKDIDYVAHHLVGRDGLEPGAILKPSEASICVIHRANLEERFFTGSQRTLLKGSDLLGLTYKPLFPYFQGRENCFKILDGSSFVTDGDGTGIVHMAPGFGEEDQKCCERNGIEIVVPVDGQGKYTDAIYDIEASGSRLQASESNLTEAQSPEPRALYLRGLNVIADTNKSDDEPYTEAQLKKFGLANLRIINYLKHTGQLIKQEDFKHNYPHCWRTDQPLIYRAMPSWYVEVTKFRDRAVELNKEINWIPEHIRDGQMAHMLATAPDWSISRNRFWGTPIPVWRRQDSGSGLQAPEMKVFGSIAELESFFDLEACLKESGLKPEAQSPEPRITDLHRPFIDTLTIAKDGSKWQRVEDVFDCWFESGSMPFAQVHYPFENKEWFETHFPADFITEYVGQTRGWFNTLIMLATALFDKPPFKNCICHGVVLDAETGLKYSKRLKNYKDPKEVMDQFGADSLRWLMLASPVMRGMDLSVDPEGKFIRDVVRLAIKPIWNAYNFFCLYANADSISCGSRSGSTGSQRADGDPAQAQSASQDVLDQYILAKCSAAASQIQASMDAYDTPSACEAVLQFFDVLNNWYIRRSKERFWSEIKPDADPSSPEGFAGRSKQAAYDTLYTVLVTMCKAAAPLLPLTLDAVYQGLTGEESVHLADFPSPPLTTSRGGVSTRDDELIAQMDWARDVCNVGLSIRNKLNIRVRQPLSRIQILSDSDHFFESHNMWRMLSEIIKDELNIKYLDKGVGIGNIATLKLSINSQVLGKIMPDKMKQILPASKKGEWKQVDGKVEVAGVILPEGSYTLQLEPKPEYKDRAQALSSNDALVILDTTITPELEAEGIARDVVRMVQQARKDGGLKITDHIDLALVSTGKTAAAVTMHQDYIAQQTLTNNLSSAAIADASYHTSGMIEGETVDIFLKREG